jgi:hypothetical protein
MEQLPQFKTKLCRYGEHCRHLPRGTCTFAHSTEEQRAYVNPWINAEYGVVTLQNNAIVDWKSTIDKGAAMDMFFAAAVTLGPVEAATCKDSCLFLKFSTTLLLLTGLPKQENAEVLRRITALPTSSPP